MPSSSAIRHSCRTWSRVRNCASSTRMQSSLRLLQLLDDRVEQVDVRRRKCCAGADSAMREPIVPAPERSSMRRGPQHRLHAALAIVEIGLQQGGRFARVHRRIIEIELGHQGQSDPAGARLEVAEADRGDGLAANVRSPGRPLAGTAQDLRGAWSCRRARSARRGRRSRSCCCW